MKPSRSEQRHHALTLLEVLVVIFALAILAAVLLHATQAANRKANRIQCVNNLAQISLAFRIWEGDHKDFYPMDVAITNGGAMQQAANGDVAAVFLVISNELATPMSVICPADTNHFQATNFSAGFSARNISYFLNPDANEENPQMMLLGDDNFEVAGVPVKSGILNLPSNCPIAWTAARHNRCGNIAITDGSVQQFNTTGLQECIGFATNRIAIP